MQKGVFIGLVLCLCGCRSPRPASHSQWGACLLQGKTIKLLQIPKGASFLSHQLQPSAARMVVYLRAEWGRSPFVSEYSWGFLMLSLPQRLRAGQSYAVSPRDPAIYREGGMAVVYNSTQIHGKVKILKLASGWVELRYDLMAQKPDRNMRKKASYAIRGTSRLRVAKSSRSCPSR